MPLYLGIGIPGNFSSTEVEGEVGALWWERKNWARILASTQPCINHNHRACVRWLLAASSCRQAGRLRWAGVRGPGLRAGWPGRLAVWEAAEPQEPGIRPWT